MSHLKRGTGTLMRKKRVKKKKKKLTDYIILPSTEPRKIKAEEDISVLKSQQTQAGLLQK